MTKVIFRKYKDDGEIIAFLPETEVRYGNIMAYQHIGQHGEASYDFYLTGTQPAKPEEYKDLLNEMQNIVGYDDLVVKQRVSHKDLEESWA